MTIGIVDTTVLVHLYRNNPDALVWADQWQQQLAITSISWLEVMVGASGKAGQARCKVIFDQFELVYLTQADQIWAMQQIERYRLSHGVSVNDSLIASVAHRLQIPLYTHNLKHMRVLLGDTLPQKPY
jgi:predicted nucleic acid-binding protein